MTEFLWSIGHGRLNQAESQEAFWVKCLLWNSTRQMSLPDSWRTPAFVCLVTGCEIHPFLPFSVDEIHFFANEIPMVCVFHRPFLNPDVQRDLNPFNIHPVKIIPSPYC